MLKKITLMCSLRLLISIVKVLERIIERKYVCLTFEKRDFTQFFLYSTTNDIIKVVNMNFYVIFHKRVRVYYQGLQTRENNEIVRAMARVIFVVLECL